MTRKSRDIYGEIKVGRLKMRDMNKRDGAIHDNASTKQLGLRNKIFIRSTAL